MFEVGGVAVVECETNILALGRGIEQRLEPLIRDPYIRLAGLQRPRRVADAVERQGDRTHLHRPINVSMLPALADQLRRSGSEDEVPADRCPRVPADGNPYRSSQSSMTPR